MKELIAERLKTLRLGAHLSQTKMAEIVGTQQSSIYRYEQGRAVPVPEIFVRYADYFDVSMDHGENCTSTSLNYFTIKPRTIRKCGSL